MTTTKTNRTPRNLKFSFLSILVISNLMATSPALADNVPAFASVGFSDWGGMGSNNSTAVQLKCDSDKCTATTCQMQRNEDGFYHLKKGELPANAKSHTVPKDNFLRVWKLVEEAKLMERKQSDADRAGPDAPYCSLVIKWGDSAQKCTMNGLVFRKDTETYKMIVPTVEALKKVAE